jgi:hypothetical protein
MNKFTKAVIAGLALITMVIVLTTNAQGRDATEVSQQATSSEVSFLEDGTKVIVLSSLDEVPYPTETPEPTATPSKEDEMMDSELWWLARGMQEEAGVDWSDEDIAKIGTVIMNRVESDLFPNTVKEVLLQDGQYQPFFGDYTPQKPDERYIYLAWVILDGYRSWDDPDVIWQATFIQGNQVVDSVYDSYLGSTTYFCK